MIRNLLLLLVVGFTASTAFSQAVTYTIEGTDTWGDGWNGGSVDITYNGVTTSYTLPTSGGGNVSFTDVIGTIDVVPGDPIDIVLCVGGFPTEMSYEILDPAGTVVFDGAGAGTPSGDCNPPVSVVLQPVQCAIICPVSGSGTFVDQYFLEGDDCGVIVSIPYELTGTCTSPGETIEGFDDALASSVVIDANTAAGNIATCSIMDFDSAAGTLTMNATDDEQFGGSGSNDCANNWGHVWQINMPFAGEMCFTYEITSDDAGGGDEFGFAVGVDYENGPSGNFLNAFYLDPFAATGPFHTFLGNTTGDTGTMCVTAGAGEPISLVVVNPNFTISDAGALSVDISGFEFTELVSLPTGPVVLEVELGAGEDQIVDIVVPLEDGTELTCAVEIDVFESDVVPVTALACNDDINISVDENCMVQIGADMFLEGGPYGCYDDYKVRIRPFGGAAYLEVGGDSNVNTLSLELPAGQHIYEVLNPDMTNTCWGYFTIEDKLAPTLVCDCPVGGNPVAEDLETELVAGTTIDFATVGTACTPSQNEGDGVDALVPTPVVEFSFTAPGTMQGITISAISDWGDAQLYVYDQPIGADVCEGLVAFDGDSGPGFDPIVTMDVEEGQEYFVYLGAWNAGQLGAVTLSTTSPGGPILLTGQQVGFEFAPECTFQCSDEFNWEIIDELPGVTVEDNCGAGDLTSTDVWTDGDECGTRVLIRSWLLTDPATGATSTCAQQFVFEAITAADLSLPPATVVLSCGGDSSPESIAAELGITSAYPHYFVGDKDFDSDGNFIGYAQRAVAVNNNVCNLFASYTDVDITDCPGCPGNKKVIRSWSILDWCDGSTTPYTQIIKASDSDAPFVSAPDVTVSVNPWTCTAEFYLPCPEHLGDDCYGDNLNYEVVGPAGVTITQVASTLCSTGYQYIASGAPKTMFDAPHTFTYVATDCCGNVGESDIAVTVLDNTPPVAIAKEYIVISLTSTPGQQDGSAKMYPQSVDNGSHDGDCGDVALEIRRADGAPACGNIGINGHNNNETFSNDVGLSSSSLDPNNFADHPDDDRDDTDEGAFVKFCCEDLTDVDDNGNAYGTVEVLLRVWDDGNMTGVYGDFIDANGNNVLEPFGEVDNYSDTWAFVRVEDKLAAQIVCPANITLLCDQDYTDTSITGMASASATCSGVGVTYSDDTDISTCGAGTVERTWCVEGTNNCCTQVITINYYSTWDPCDRDAGIVWPRDYTGEASPADEWCGREINPAAAIDCIDQGTGEPTWTESSCDLIGYSLDSDTFYFEDNACFKVLNNWTVINWCLYDGGTEGIYEHTQIVKYVDEVAPEVSAEENCYPVEDGCETIPPVQAVACDTLSDCNSDWIKWQAEVDINGDWTVDYVYSSFIADIAANRPFYVDPTNSCEPVSLTLPAPIEASKLRHRVLWRATDGCGNVTSYTSYFTVEDKKAPTPYCINLSTALMENGEVELWACDFDAGAFDNCTPTDWLSFTFNGPEDGFYAPEDTPDFDPETNCQGKTFDCGHFEIAQANGGLYPVRIYVWDECGNVDFCMVNLRLVDNSSACSLTGASRISGEIYTEEGDMVVDAMVESNEMTGTFYNMDMTNDAGVYDIAAQESMDYELSAVKNDDYLNGVTTLDILLIQKHILDIQTLDSPYKLIAADASNDQRVSAVDLIQLRKLILGIYEELPSNDSWRFVDAKETLNDVNPWPFTETIDVMNLTNDVSDEDFVGVKIGDVNGSVEAQNFTSDNGVDARSSNDLVLNAVATVVGTEVSIDVTSSNFNEVSGFQFTMEANGLELTNVQAGALDVTAENFAVVNGKVTSSWNSYTAVSTDDVLFTLTFTGADANAVAINSSITKAEAYVGSDLEIVGVQLGTDTADGAFALMQNEPNPFNNTTVVGFNLPTESTATLTVYDVTGKVLSTVTSTYSQGYNEIELSKKDMSTSGVLYYQLDSGDFTATKKMIILD